MRRIFCPEYFLNTLTGKSVKVFLTRTPSLLKEPAFPFFLHFRKPYIFFKEKYDYEKKLFPL